MLYEHAAVREAAVVGVPDEYRGETVKAFVSLKAGRRPTPDELIAFCKERMAAYKYPRQVEIVDELPKTVDRQDPAPRAAGLNDTRPPGARAAAAGWEPSGARLRGAGQRDRHRDPAARGGDDRDVRGRAVGVRDEDAAGVDGAEAPGAEARPPEQVARARADHEAPGVNVVDGRRVHAVVDLDGLRGPGPIGGVRDADAERRLVPAVVDARLVPAVVARQPLRAEAVPGDDDRARAAVRRTRTRPARRPPCPRGCR